jgi:hypothetical protein
MNTDVTPISNPSTDRVSTTVTLKTKKKVDLKKVPFQTDDTPKTKRRYFYEKTGNYVTYARAKQLNLVK